MIHCYRRVDQYLERSRSLKHCNPVNREGSFLLHDQILYMDGGANNSSLPCGDCILVRIQHLINIHKTHSPICFFPR